jgi:hypothetical protein
MNIAILSAASLLFIGNFPAACVSSLIAVCEINGGLSGDI